MDFKFKKNDLVSINFSAFCSVFDAHNDEAEAEPVEYHKVINCRMTDTGIEYKLRGCYGWWKEEHLSLKPKEPKFSPSRDETGGPNKDMPEEPKLDTEDSGKAREEAEWIPHQEEDRIEYECSSCRWMALNDYRGRSTDSLYCPHCGKYMTNSTMPLDED